MHCEFEPLEKGRVGIYETIDFLSEREVREVMKRFIASPRTEIGRVEGIGALNFMALDDLSVREEGEELDPKSVIELPEDGGRPLFPAFESSPDCRMVSLLLAILPPRETCAEGLARTAQRLEGSRRPTEGWASSSTP